MIEKTDEARIPLAVEEATVTKKSDVKGVTRLRLHTEEAAELVSAHLARQQAEIAHVLVDRLLEEGEPAPQTREENGVLIVPVVEEVAVVVKRIRVVEELHVTLRQYTEEQSLPVVLRKQHVTVERVRPDEGYPSTPETEDPSGDPT